ncbi:transposase [Bradyrhizobium sp. CCGUVB23]|uniref:IS110 family transposase n=1 Tax=Bradyrhizobium sp. CCGUVB23 TaxID=2949630 RepID=UPI003531E2E7
MRTTRYIGLDVHKESIAAAVADGRKRVSSGRLPTRRRSSQSSSLNSKDNAQLHFADEAGCCGYGIYRQISKLGHRCDVVAPGLIPVRRSERVKNDRRDALMIARLLRAGELAPVWDPRAPRRLDITQVPGH